MIRLLYLIVDSNLKWKKNFKEFGMSERGGKTLGGRSERASLSSDFHGLIV